MQVLGTLAGGISKSGSMSGDSFLTIRFVAVFDFFLGTFLLVLVPDETVGGMSDNHLGNTLSLFVLPAGFEEILTRVESETILSEPTGCSLLSVISSVVLFSTFKVGNSAFSPPTVLLVSSPSSLVLESCFSEGEGSKLPNKSSRGSLIIAGGTGCEESSSAFFGAMGSECKTDESDDKVSGSCARFIVGCSTETILKSSSPPGSREMESP